MKSILLLSTIGLALSTGCSAMFEAKGAAESAIKTFHTQLDDGKFDDIWNGAHQKMHNAATREKFDELLSVVQRKLGKVTPSTNNGINIKTMNSVTTVEMKQDTKFEHGEGTESFTFVMEGDRAVLAGYNINSMDLITK